jgi:hypothetical protein
MFGLSCKTVVLAAAIAMLSTGAVAKDDKKDVPSPNPAPITNPIVVAGCELADLQGAMACNGYYAGNLNGESKVMVASAQFALTALGYSWDGSMEGVKKIDSFDDKKMVSFERLLKGTNFVSIHYGAGEGPAKTKGGTTGFYKIESTEGLFGLKTKYGSLSNAVLYLQPKVNTIIKDDAYGPSGNSGAATGAVPEPAVWLQLIVGFGLVGLHRRRQQQRQKQLAAQSGR